MCLVFECQCEKMEPDMKANSAIELLFAENIALTDINWYFLNVYWDQIVDVTLIMWILS